MKRMHSKQAARRQVRLLGLVGTLLACSSTAAPPLVGQGLPFHTQTALTTAFEETGVRLFSMYGSRGNTSTWSTPIVVLPFAPHERINTKVAIPLIRRSRTIPGASGATFEATGFGDLVLEAKWTFFARNRFQGTTRVGVFGGLSLPTGSTDQQLVAGGRAPRPLQLGAGARSARLGVVATLIRGQWGASADVSHLRPATSENFRHGRTTRYDLAVGLRFPAHVETIDTRTLQLYLEWNGTATARAVSGSEDVADSGGHVGFLSPGIQWVPLSRLLIEASVQFPVLQDLNGSQSRWGVRPAIGVRLLFL